MRRFATYLVVRSSEPCYGLHSWRDSGGKQLPSFCTSIPCLYDGQLTWLVSSSGWAGLVGPSIHRLRCLCCPPPWEQSAARGSEPPLGDHHPRDGHEAVRPPRTPASARAIASSDPIQSAAVCWPRAGGDSRLSSPIIVAAVLRHWSSGQRLTHAIDDLTNNLRPRPAPLCARRILTPLCASRPPCRPARSTAASCPCCSLCPARHSPLAPTPHCGRSSPLSETRAPFLGLCRSRRH